MMVMQSRMRATPRARRGEPIEVRIVIQHPMETGFRYDALGRQTPRNVIDRFECRYAGAVVFRAEMGAGIAANPYLRFFVRAKESGEIECRWVDQQNISGSASTHVTVTD
jgi:sulfur-oxidizing protein SoxZ